MPCGYCGKLSKQWVHDGLHLFVDVLSSARQVLWPGNDVVVGCTVCDGSVLARGRLGAVPDMCAWQLCAQHRHGGMFGVSGWSIR